MRRALLLGAVATVLGTLVTPSSAEARGRLFQRGSACSSCATTCYSSCDAVPWQMACAEPVPGPVVQMPPPMGAPPPGMNWVPQIVLRTETVMMRDSMGRMVPVTVTRQVMEYVAQPQSYRDESLGSIDAARLRKDVDALRKDVDDLKGKIKPTGSDTGNNP